MPKSSRPKSKQHTIWVAFDFQWENELIFEAFAGHTVSVFVVVFDTSQYWHLQPEIHGWCAADQEVCVYPKLEGGAWSEEGSAYAAPLDDIKGTVA